MRVLVTGSRDWSGVYGTNRIHVVLNMLLAFCEVLGDKLTLIHGDCPTGADRIVDDWALRREDSGVTVERHPADWRTLGKQAGPIRNQYMVNNGNLDMCIGFLRGSSRGTSVTLNMSREARIPTYTIRWEQDLE
jgi:hypothetical protein